MSLSDASFIEQEMGTIEGVKFYANQYLIQTPINPICQECKEEIEAKTVYLVIGEKSPKKSYHLECFPGPTEEILEHLSPAFILAEL
ncbi:hypothetical protein AMET1_0010 [Methanonatronarchaeum thermophilum]|uniref:Uncharacterized protein n=1 Tax=Methanonatronarchaeum thermophilum TaxID=1927129 RepID=A0A1Y3GD05_9EURY|nr:hypothetical protein [Methanonatronarchaeum thermophilum]OUJ19341.1 hypothetical protein AMET1_0010 [Methanonatronarchaeum thermophilum]